MVLGLRFQRAPGKPARASARPSGLAPGGGFQDEVESPFLGPPSSPPNGKARDLTGLGAPGCPAAGQARPAPLGLLPQEPGWRRGDQSTPRRALTLCADGADVGPGSPSAAAAPRGPAPPGAVAPSQRGAAGRAQHGGAHGAGRGERGAGRPLCGPGSPRRLSSVPVPSASGSGALPRPHGRGEAAAEPGSRRRFPPAPGPREVCRGNESKALEGASARRRPARRGRRFREGAGLFCADVRAGPGHGFPEVGR